MVYNAVNILYLFVQDLFFRKWITRGIYDCDPAIMKTPLKSFTFYKVTGKLGAWLPHWHVFEWLENPFKI